MITPSQMNRLYKILGVDYVHACEGERIEPHIDRLLDALEQYVERCHPTINGCGDHLP